METLVQSILYVELTRLFVIFSIFPEIEALLQENPVVGQNSFDHWSPYLVNFSLPWHFSEGHIQ